LGKGVWKICSDRTYLAPLRIVTVTISKFHGALEKLHLLSVTLGETYRMFALLKEHVICPVFDAIYVAHSSTIL
jgi:hypothetical protein